MWTTPQNRRIARRTILVVGVVAGVLIVVVVVVVVVAAVDVDVVEDGDVASKHPTC